MSTVNRFLTLHVDDDRGYWAVFGWSGLGNVRPRLTRLWLGVGNPPELDTFDPWDADSAGSIDAATLRSFRITSTQKELARLRVESTNNRKCSMKFDVANRDLLDTAVAKQVGLRSVADLRAAVDRLEVAYLYVERINLGDTKPAVAIAEQLHIPVQTVRVRLQRARADGYLTGGGQGWAGGELTDRAQELDSSIAHAVGKVSRAVGVL